MKSSSQLLAESAASAAKEEANLAKQKERSDTSHSVFLSWLTRKAQQETVERGKIRESQRKDKEKRKNERDQKWKKKPLAGCHYHSEAAKIIRQRKKGF